MITKRLAMVVTFGLLGLALALLGLYAALPDIAQAVDISANGAEITVCLAGPPDCQYSSIQAAVDAASEGDVIKVAAGTYTDVHVRPRDDVTTTGVVTQMVYLTKTLTVEGGYTTTNWTTPDPEANPTTLDSQGQGRVLYLTGDISPTIEGLRITGGDAKGMGGQAAAVSEDSGGGIYIWDALAVLENNWIYDNTAAWGGGLYLFDSGWTWDKPGATIASNTIFSNTAGTGGGIAIHLSTADINDNVIRDNYAGWGGGLRVEWSSPTIRQNIISANTASWEGGGGSIALSEPVLINNVILDNQAQGRGSGLAIGGNSPRMSHNTIARNTGGDGIGVYVEEAFDWAPAMVWMTNTVLVDQPVGISASGISTVTVNGILWYNTPVTATQSATAVVTVQNQHTGNPAFAADGYHLTAASAARDKGVDTNVMVDIDGERRPAGAGYDLGADELWYKVYLPLVLRNS